MSQENTPSASGTPYNQARENAPISSETPQIQAQLISNMIKFLASPGIEGPLVEILLSLSPDNRNNIQESFHMLRINSLFFPFSFWEYLFLRNESAGFFLTNLI